MQNSARWVLPQPGRASVGLRIRAPLHLAERHFDFAQRIIARFVEARRLRGRPDKKPVEEIRKRRVVVPVTQQTAQKIRPP
ncbi:MAG: hypothetical protein HW373_519 [Deltaproteobacteria bacterium]|nr:hypothetical protein [Deltaproteobacteria bacterium]